MAIKILEFEKNPSVEQVRAANRPSKPSDSNIGR